MLIRHARPEDVSQIIELERQAPGLSHWSEQAYRDVFKKGAPQRVLLVGEVEGALRGFLIARLAAGDCELENIVIAPFIRRRGFASRLLQSLTAEARRRGAGAIFLEVRESNCAARALYRKFGFRETGRRDAYYSNPVEGAILYALSL